LDARAHGGRWLVRIEDLDAPRIIPGSEAAILETLHRFGFEWDELTRQSERTERYAAALEDLAQQGLTFACSCSRSQLADETRYPGHCRAHPLIPGVATATRLRIEPGHIQFTDRIQGTFRQDVAAAVGDMVLRRRDGFFAYVLAVVVDDAAQGVSDVVRGADLLDNTPRQILLQRSLRLPTPRYAHVPALVEADGRKLAKSARSVAITTAALPELIRVFELLGLAPPASLAAATLTDAWAWAVAQWRVERVPKRLACPLNERQ
jgi:glutamyl-Q tRNA(Asp) synthetase